MKSLLAGYILHSSFRMDLQEALSRNCRSCRNQKHEAKVGAGPDLILRVAHLDDQVRNEGCNLQVVQVEAVL